MKAIVGHVLSAGYVRPAAVAGLFYPGVPERLADEVDELLGAAQDEAHHPVPKAIIAPHAGYVYSGATAARAYARVVEGRGKLRRVVLLGPAHRVAFNGVALPDADAFSTPLGTVRVDHEATALLLNWPEVVHGRAAQAAEHALEVHLPFLQRALGSEFTLVPLVVGNITHQSLARIIDRLWGGPETLIVVSSDLSHYLRYREAVQTDATTVAAILSKATSLNHAQACGATPINALMQVARDKRLRVELVDQCNSGDTAGDREKVVGYASFALYDASGPAAELEDPHESVVPQGFPASGGDVLVRLARDAIDVALGGNRGLDFSPPWLGVPAATFVTLTQHGRLRGCIGSLVAHRSLGIDVIENARAAAFRDPRFPPLTAEELRTLMVEVSVLGQAKPVRFTTEADLIRQIIPHKDGLILEAGDRRSTFLPQVWSQIPDPQAFLAALRQKAGLRADHFGPDLRVSRYRVVKFVE